MGEVSEITEGQKHTAFGISLIENGWLDKRREMKKQTTNIQCIVFSCLKNITLKSSETIIIYCCVGGDSCLNIYEISSFSFSVTAFFFVYV